MRNLIEELSRRSPVLAVTALLHAFLFAVTIALITVDSRMVLGVNAWIKPMKFMVSIAIYAATVAWLAGYLERPRWAIRVVTWGIAIAMITETACLFIQSARGTTSHFNISTAFDASIFSLMGSMIFLDTVLMIALLGLFFRKDIALPPQYLWGIRIGIMVFLAGSWVGTQLIANGGHAVGVPDGGPGLPLVNWSTEAGDLRIAHALGLHGLQVFPLVGFWLSQRAAVGKRPTSILYLVGLGTVYVTIFLAAYLQAKSGKPLIAM